MKYKNFEDLPVWKDGMRLTKRIFEITGDKSFKGQGDLANQIQRAALSIPNNIAEGFERGTTNELIQFIYYAKGSAGEVRSMCLLIISMERFAHLNLETSDLKTMSTSISKQLGAWAFSLQEGDIKGSKFLTDQKRETYQQKQTGDAIGERLKQEHEERLKELTQGRKL